MNRYPHASIPLLLAAMAITALAPAAERGGWPDPPGGWDYVYEANAGEDKYVAGDNVVGLLDGTWAQHIGTSEWDGSAPGVFNTTEKDGNGKLLPPAPGGAIVVCPDGELGEDGKPLCYLDIEDVGDPTTFNPAYADPSNRKMVFHHQVTGDAHVGWTLVARLRLSPTAIDPNMKMAAGHNGADVTDMPMVSVHDSGDGTAGFSINDAGRLVVLTDGTDHEIDIGDPTSWVTVWMAAAELAGTPSGRYDVKTYVNGAATPSLTLAGIQAPMTEITGAPDHWIAIGSARTALDAAFQIDYVAIKSGYWEPDQTFACPSAFSSSIVRENGRAAVSVTWTNPADPFDSFTLKRDGSVLAATLAAATTSYLDIAPLPGHHVYELEAKKGQDACILSADEGMGAVDLDGAFEAGAQAGTADCRLSWRNPGGLDAIDVTRHIEHANNANEADEKLGTLPGTATEYVDPALPAADLTRVTYTLTSRAGEWTSRVQCAPTTCPHAARCDAVWDGGKPAVVVSWSMARTFDSIAIGRRTDTSKAFDPLPALAGTATSYRDADVALFGFYEYQVTAAAGGAAEACAAVTCRITVLPGEAEYEPPAGGWDYIYDAEGQAADLYDKKAGEAGNLDGKWIRSTNEDFWSGSRPGASGDPPAGPAPGGISVVALPAADPCGKEDRKVLLLEDPGDPRALGYPDPSNRKLVLGCDIGHAGENVLRTGATFAFRIRLRPVPVDIPVEPGNAPWDGDALAKGLGMVGIHFRNSGNAALGASAGLAFTLEEETASLTFDPAVQITGVHPEAFHTVWATVRDPEGDDTYEVNLYVNGGLTPMALTGSLQAPAPNHTGNDLGLGAAVQNFLAIGTVNTAGDASVEIDYVAWKAGVHVPVPRACGGPPPAVFRRGDVDGNGSLELTDAIALLGFMFLGAAAPSCYDAADADDSGSLELTDAIWILNYQFLGGERPPPPGPDICGPDTTFSADATPCVYESCGP